MITKPSESAKKTTDISLGLKERGLAIITPEVLNRFSKLKSERYSNWFNEFLRRTDEKLRLEKIFERLFSNDTTSYMRNGKSCKLFDVGFGDGTLTVKVAKWVEATVSDVTYDGIELEGKYVEHTSDILHDIDIKHNLKQGSFLNNEDLSSFPDDYDIIIASHVAYYAKNVSDFVLSLISKIDQAGTLVFFHQSELSSVTVMRNKYSLDTTSSPTLEIRNILESKGYKVLDILYPSYIDFGSAGLELVTLDDLLKVYREEGRDTMHVKFNNLMNLVEFVFHAPLEWLEKNGKLEEAIEMLKRTLVSQNSYLTFWDGLQIASKIKEVDKKSIKEIESKNVLIKTSSSKENREPEKKKELVDPLKLKMERVDLGVLTPLEAACFEGNVRVVKRLLYQLGTKEEIDREFKGLIYASLNGHIKIVEFLLREKYRYKYDIDATDGRKTKFTALHIASKSALCEDVEQGKLYYRIAELLIEAGADLYNDQCGVKATYYFYKAREKFRKIYDKEKFDYKEFINSVSLRKEEEVYIEAVSSKGKKYIDQIQFNIRNRVNVIEGPPGCGKTSLSARYARVLFSEYDRINLGHPFILPRTINIKSDLLENLQMTFKMLVEHFFGVNVQEFESDKKKVHQDIAEKIRRLSPLLNLLIVFDNVIYFEEDGKLSTSAEVEEYIKLLKKGKNIKILITTRRYSGDLYPIEMESFSVHEARSYITERLEKSASKYGDYTEDEVEKLIEVEQLMPQTLNLAMNTIINGQLRIRYYIKTIKDKAALRRTNENIRNLLKGRADHLKTELSKKTLKLVGKSLNSKNTQINPKEYIAIYNDISEQGAVFSNNQLKNYFRIFQANANVDLTFEVALDGIRRNREAWDLLYHVAYCGSEKFDKKFLIDDINIISNDDIYNVVVMHLNTRGVIKLGPDGLSSFSIHRRMQSEVRKYVNLHGIEEQKALKVLVTRFHRVFSKFKATDKQIEHDLLVRRYLGHLEIIINHVFRLISNNSEKIHNIFDEKELHLLVELVERLGDYKYYKTLKYADSYKLYQEAITIIERVGGAYKLLLLPMYQDYVDKLQKKMKLSYSKLYFYNLNVGTIKEKARAIRDNKIVTKLDFSNSDIGLEEIRVLAEALRKDNTVRYLNLVGNNIGIEESRVLLNMLNDNSFIQRIDIFESPFSILIAQLPRVVLRSSSSFLSGAIFGVLSMRVEGLDNRFITRWRGERLTTFFYLSGEDIRFYVIFPVGIITMSLMAVFTEAGVMTGACASFILMGLTIGFLGYTEVDGMVTGGVTALISSIMGIVKIFLIKAINWYQSGDTVYESIECGLSKNRKNNAQIQISRELDLDLLDIINSLKYEDKIAVADFTKYSLGIDSAQLLADVFQENHNIKKIRISKEISFIDAVTGVSTLGNWIGASIIILFGCYLGLDGQISTVEKTGFWKSMLVGSIGSYTGLYMSESALTTNSRFWIADVSLSIFGGFLGGLIIYVLKNKIGRDKIVEFLAEVLTSTSGIFGFAVAGLVLPTVVATVMGLYGQYQYGQIVKKIDQLNKDREETKDNIVNDSFCLEIGLNFNRKAETINDADYSQSVIAHNFSGYLNSHIGITNKQGLLQDKDILLATVSDNLISRFGKSLGCGIFKKIYEPLVRQDNFLEKISEIENLEQYEKLFCLNIPLISIPKLGYILCRENSEQMQEKMNFKHYFCINELEKSLDLVPVIGGESLFE